MLILNGSAEIDDLDGDAILSSTEQHDVLQLDIAMDDMQRVHVGQCTQQLPHYPGDHVFALASESFEGIDDGPSSAVLHHHIVFLVEVE